MSCSHPLRGFWSKKRHPNTNNRYIVFNPSKAYLDLPVEVPCGKCPLCLLSRSYQWSMRCVCESLSYSESYFLTLTYDPEHLPSDGQLNRAHLTSFIKRLRWRFRDYKLKVFYCGEYGERRHRPHYHLIVFGLPLAREGYRLFPVNYSRRGNINYHNPAITELWGNGLCTIGLFSSSSASYVAQYTLKKSKFVASINKDPKYLVKPFIGASNRNALGYDFFFKYYKSIYERGWFNLEPSSRKIVRPLKFFNYLLKKHFPLLHFKYIELPNRIKRTRDNIRYLAHYPEFCEDFKEDYRRRLLRERKILRSLQARMDLL